MSLMIQRSKIVSRYYPTPSAIVWKEQILDLAFSMCVQNRISMCFSQNISVFLSTTTLLLHVPIPQNWLVIQFRVNDIGPQYFDSSCLTLLFENLMIIQASGNPVNTIASACSGLKSTLLCFSNSSSFQPVSINFRLQASYRFFHAMRSLANLNVTSSVIILGLLLSQQHL